MEQLSTIHTYYAAGLQDEEREVRNRMQAAALKFVESHVTLEGAEPTLKNVDRCYRWAEMIAKSSLSDPDFIYIVHRMYWVGTLLPAIKQALESRSATSFVRLWEYVNDCEAEIEENTALYEAFPPFSFFVLTNYAFKEDQTVLAKHDLARHNIRLIQIRAGSTPEGESPRIWQYGIKWLRKTRYRDITQPRPVELDKIQAIFHAATRAKDLVAYTEVQDRLQLEALNSWLEKEAGRIQDAYTDSNFPLLVEVRRKKAKPLNEWKVQVITIQQLQAVGQ